MFWEVETIKVEELWNKKAIHSVKQCLTKDTIELLMESDADYLMIDLYDFHTDMGVVGNAFFSTCAHEFFNTALYQKHKDEVRLVNFMSMPKEIWYPYVDKFFEIIMEKYDSDHIILNRFRSSTYFLDTDGVIKLLPDTFKKGFQSNDKYNCKIAELEDYIIAKYNPYVIDLTKFFMSDVIYWGGTPHGAHLEKAFYNRAFAQVKRIINGETDCKYYNDPGFFQEENEIANIPLDIEGGLEMLDVLLNVNDILWMNILDKLNKYAPEHEKVQLYMQYFQNAQES